MKQEQIDMKNISSAHESGHLHVTGEAVYVDDMLSSSTTLEGYVLYSKYAHALIRQVQIEEAQKFPGVFAVLTFKDIPGHNQMGPVCLLYTSPSPRDLSTSRMPSSA